ncbi:YqzL family protein [Paenibacillus solisilvae]|uniref:YqzL family protein n=1 Tax=Paenibacillus solisilvae TaxID=2486751 RepID=A0ABW0W3Y1_9BACL
MRDFSWKYFTLTGDVESFLLYKEVDGLASADTASSGESEAEDASEADQAQSL